jgi:hypothetical protein
MSTKILVNLDLSKNQLLNAAIQNLASAPSAPVEGQLYQNTTDHKMYRYNGSAWVEVSGGSGAGDFSGPASSTQGNLVTFADANGKTGADSGISGTNVSDAVSKKHSQNTDTGTTAAAFQVDSSSSGPKLKNNSGVLEVRNAADNAYADLKVANLTVDGTITTVTATELRVDDNAIVLNKNVTGTPDTDASVQVERGTADNASLKWDESNDRWAAGTAGAEKAIARKHTATIGDGEATTIAVTHNLGTDDVVVSVRLAASPYAQVLCDVEHTDANTVTLKFAVAPTSNELKVVVIG